MAHRLINIFQKSNVARRTSHEPNSTDLLELTQALGFNNRRHWKLNVCHGNNAKVWYEMSCEWL